jgi:hypothetical protein
MRNGAPVQGAIGAGKTATSAVSSQLPEGACACELTLEKSKTMNAAVICNTLVTAEQN